LENIKDNIMLTEISQVSYIVKVLGQPVGPKYPTAQLAEAALLNLSPEHQAIAEIVPVQRDTGKELLLG
jgi:hypothetical protein